MNDYLLFFRGGLDFSNATEEQLQQAMTKWKTWMEELGKQGRMAGGQRLNRNAKVLKGKRKDISDGPFAEGKEIVGGYLSIKAEGLDEAVNIAKGCPIFDYDGTVEVREVIPV